MEIFRIFVGISLSGPITERLAAIMKTLAADLPFRRWTHPSDVHVTLHFLGDTPVSKLDALREAAAVTAAESKPLSLGLTEPGTFGPRDAPRILWCGIAEPDHPGALARLQAEMAPRLAETGFEPETRPFRAHVTLARQGGAGCGPDAIEAAWRKAAAAELAKGPLTWTAGTVTLFRSHLGRRPSYERLDEFPLGAD